MTEGMGFGELVIVAVIVLVPVVAAVLLIRALLRALGRRGSASGEVASLRARVDRLEAERGSDATVRDSQPGLDRR